MSPRRKLEPQVGGDEATVDATTPGKRSWRDWASYARGLAGLAVAATLLVVAAVVVTSLMLWSHVSDRRSETADVEVLGSVGQFMTEYTTLDPFHANEYADKIVARATGDFAKQFKEKQNQILISVARAEPTQGTVLEAGIERWHDDGSVSVLVATKMRTTVGDPKKPVDSGNRWVVTAVKEGQQWKISQLTEVI